MNISLLKKFTLVVVLLLSGCTAVGIQRKFWAANTSVALDEEKKGNIAGAETEYINALARARRNNLTENLSDSLYYLGSFYARQKRTAEAIKYLHESITVEETLSGTNSVKTGRRVAALANVYLMDYNLYEGRPFAERLKAIIPAFTGEERDAAAEIVDVYERKWAASDRELKKWKPLADQGNAEALYVIATMYEDGRGVERNMNKAIELYKTSADKGFIESQYYLGVIYDKGRGVTPDDVKARDLYRIAAEKGSAQAQYNYAVMLIQGRGGSEDKAEAAAWMKKASAQGNKAAQMWLKKNGQ